MVRERFAAFGLTRGPHRVVATTRTWEGEASLGLKLRLVLGDLGPIFASFGRYLATRVDLLDAADCLELEGIADESSPMSLATVLQLIEREIGTASDEVFLSFESEPFESRLLHQLHRARLLRNGMPVIVKLVRPEAAAQLLCDLELLELVVPLLDGPAQSGIYQRAIDDFAAMLRQEVDLTNEAGGLETLRRDTEDFEMLRVPGVLRDLCTSSMLTTEHLARMSDNKTELLDQQSVARLLCSAWLRQALVGHVFPVEPTPANVAVISDRQIAFTGGVFSSLSGESQSNLWNYLTAAASDSPDQACSCLLREVRADGPRGGEEDLRHRFRQIVPFRDSGWYSDDSTNRLIEHLVVQWQAATGCGYMPQQHLPAFFRGLFAISRLAQRFSTGTDALVEGLQEARLLESVARMRDMLSLQRLGDHADKYAAIMMAMPQRLDQMLMLASEGSARIKLHVPETASNRRRKNSAAVTVAMLLLFAAVTFVLPRVSSSLLGDSWSGRINAVTFIACGALLLLAVSRTQ